MEKITLGNSDLKISPISFGAWSIGGPPFWRDRGKAESVKAIKKAIDLGINLIDTAPVYGFGRSEEFVREAIKGKRGQVIVATKCGLRWKKESLGGIYHDLSPESINLEVENSLKRLGVERIDLYQIHWPDEERPIADTMGTLAKLQDSGKIRYIGVSNFSVTQIEEAMKYAEVVSLQPPYNMLQRDIEKTELPFCRKNNIAVLPYSSLASGLLSGKYDSKSKFDGWRGKGNMGLFKKDVLATVMEKVEILDAIAKAHDITLSALAIQWLINREGVTSAIVGANTAEQVEQNVRGLDVEISDSVWGKVEGVIG